MLFPTEIFAHILGFLDEEDLLQTAARVSKNFQQLAYTSVLLTERDCQEPYGVSINHHRSPILTVLLSALFPIELPQICYSFSFLRSDHRLQNEVDRLRRALRKRVEMGDRIGELVLDFARINPALLFNSETPDDGHQQNQEEALQAFSNLFDDATRVCETFTVTCSLREDSTSANTILLTKPSGEVARVHGPRGAITYLRALMAQCLPQLIPPQDDSQPIHLSTSPPLQLSKAYPPVTSTLKIQSTAMLFSSPLLSRWTQDILRSPCVQVLALHDIELPREQWRMIIPLMNLGATGRLRELIIEGCDIRFQDICLLLNRCTKSLQSVIVVPANTPPRDLTASGQQLTIPSATFLRLPLPWLQDVFIPPSTFGQELTSLGVSLGSSASQDHIPMQELNNRLRFPHLQEISIAIHVPSTGHNAAFSPINMPEISQTVGNILTSFPGDDKPSFSLLISLENPHDVSLIFPTSSSSPASPRLGRPKTARTRQRKMQLLPSLSPPMLPSTTVPLSPASYSSSLGLGIIGFGSASDGIPSMTLSPTLLHPSPPQSPPQSHQTIAHALSSHASSGFSYPPTSKPTGQTIPPEGRPSYHVFGNDLRNLRFIQHLIVRTTLYSLPDWIWERNDGFVVWVERYFGSGIFSDDEGLQRISFVEWGFRDHPTLREQESQRKGKGTEGIRTSAATSETVSPDSPPTHPPRRPSTLLHLNSHHPSSNLLMNARYRAPFVDHLRRACNTLKTVRIGDVEKSMYGWAAVHASSSS